MLFCVVSVGSVDLGLDGGTPEDKGVAPLVADPTLVLNVLPSRVHLPLA